jgi:hypothetical protein
MMMSVAAGGGTQARIGKQTAIVKYAPASRPGDLPRLVNKRFLVTVEGNGIDRDVLLDYARALDLNGLTELP